MKSTEAQIAMLGAATSTSKLCRWWWWWCQPSASLSFSTDDWKSRSCQRTLCCIGITACSINTQEILPIQFKSSRARFTWGCRTTPPFLSSLRPVSASLSLPSAHYKEENSARASTNAVYSKKAALWSDGSVTQRQSWFFLFTKTLRVHCAPYFWLFHWWQHGEDIWSYFPAITNPFA